MSHLPSAVFTRIRKRWLLVLAVAAGQTLVVLTASVWLFSWLNFTVADLAPAVSDPAEFERQRLAIDAFNHRLQLILITLSVAVVLFSALLTSAIIRRYENRLASINENLEKLVDVRSQALMKSRHAVIIGLAKLAESRDDQTGQHLDRIRHYVLILARQLAIKRPEFDESFIEILADTSSLHDIGKVGVPDAVLLSPQRLTDQQREIIQKHPLIGGDTLLAIRRAWGDDPFHITACEIAFSHHERWDGTGYPFGLSGEDIPLSGRIVALADVYDALTTKRVYKDALPHDQARTIVMSGSGTHFDPEIVKAFCAREDEFLRVLNGQAAKVPETALDQRA
jgi:response regulator RpfG family c-di-GMP phosphodiesterase